MDTHEEYGAQGNQEGAGGRLLLSDPGGGGGGWFGPRPGLSHPPTHPSTHPPTQPYPPLGGGGSMPSTHSHIQALENLWNNRAKLTSKKLPPLGLKPRTLNLELSTTTNLTNNQF